LYLNGLYWYKCGNLLPTGPVEEAILQITYFIYCSI
jgi:hypothetical protein